MLEKKMTNFIILLMDAVLYLFYLILFYLLLFLIKSLLNFHFTSFNFLSVYFISSNSHMKFANAKVFKNNLP